MRERNVSKLLYYIAYFAYTTKTAFSKSHSYSILYQIKSFLTRGKEKDDLMKIFVVTVWL